jgi:hypothetical protein
MIAPREQKKAISKILVHQRRNEPPCCHRLAYHLAFTKSDTAGEVSFAGMSMPTNPAFKLVLNVNRVFFRLRQQSS